MIPALYAHMNNERKKKKQQYGRVLGQERKQ
jgi:hypothetical protein